ncbi:MAG: ABC transporter permease [Candidatus Daviesbacteria bacterium]|nr:ABC transporter permease [Candidatus Daviesbacteria bacterium]
MKPNIVKNISLSIALAKAEFKLRHEGSYLGIFWYLLNPLLTFLLLFLVFSTRLGQTIDFYPLYLLLGVIMLNFFQQATYDATKVLMGNRRVIKTINFPLVSLIASIVLKFLYSHLFEFIVFVLFMFFFPVSFFGIVFYPLILVLFSSFIFGVSLILSAVSLIFTDLENIWLFISRLLLFITPIFYSVEDQPRLYFFINLFNPVYYFISASREVVIYTRVPDFWLVAGMFFWTILALLVGFISFYKLKGRVAEKL